MALQADPKRDAAIRLAQPRSANGWLTPAREWLARRDAPPAMLARLAIMLAVFVVLDHLVMHGSRLTSEALRQPVLAWELIRAISSSWTALMGISAVAVPTVLLRLWDVRWQDWAHGRSLRLFVLLVSVVTAWRSATYDYNLILDQAHYPDRMLLLTLAALVYWRPLFVLPLAFLDAAISWQFWQPIGGYSWAQEYMPLKILLLTFAAMTVRGLSGQRHPGEWLFLLCALVASFYWVPGLGKLELAWPLHEQIGNLLPATYANGWLAFLDPGDIGAVAGIVSTWNPVIVAFGMTFQVGALFVFWHRRTLLIFLSIATVFHLGVFASSGILFWQWILIDIGLLLLLKTLWPAGSPAWFDRRHFGLGIVLVGLSPWWVDPVKLAWYDSPLSYSYRFEAIGESGQRYSLPPRFFSPYDYQITLGGFSYLVDRPQPGIAWGATRNARLLEAVAGKTTLGQVEAVEAALGSQRFDAQRAARLDAFIQRFVSGFNARKSRRTAFDAIQAPRQLITFERPDAYTGSEAIARVEIFQITSLISGRNYQELRRLPVRQIDIPPRNGRD